MKLRVGALLLFSIVSTLGTSPRQCSGPGFVEVACEESLVKQTFQGQSGVKGPQGVVGMPGPTGETVSEIIDY